MKSEILVTGATGFLGRHLVEALEARGHGVRPHSSSQGDIAHCRLPIEGAHHVFHLAAKSFVPESWANPQGFYDVNVMGTVNVLEHCRRHRTPLTLISSYVYGHPRCLPVSEDHPLAAINPYAHTKILADLLGVQVPPNKAVVGANAFSHSSGIHVDGFLKQRETYEIMRPQDVGMGESRVVLTARTGRHGLLDRLTKLGYPLSEQELDQAYKRFLIVADKKQEVFDEDLLAILHDEIHPVPATFELQYLHIGIS